jgi:hypothetical protein
VGTASRPARQGQRFAVMRSMAMRFVGIGEDQETPEARNSERPRLPTSQNCSRA